MRSSINCSAIICSPTIILVIMREATGETYVPRVYFLSYKFPIYNCSLLFILFWNLYFSIYTTKIPKIFVLLSLSDLTLVSDREGIDNPFIALVARFLFVCVGTRGFARSLLLDWYLGSQNWGKYLRYFAASPFPLQGKTNACSRGSKPQHRICSSLDQPSCCSFLAFVPHDIDTSPTYL